MAYIADATNVATPADSDQARYAAAELRAIKARIIAAKGEAVAVADAAQADADTAQAAADAAQSTADGAVTDAAAAQGTADTALANAATAQGTADAALAAVAALQLKKFQYIYNGGGGYSWTVPAGVTTALFILQSGSTGRGRGGQKYAGGGYLSHYELINPDLHDVRIVRLSGLVAGQVVSLVIGHGESIYDPMITDFYNGFLVTAAPAEPTTLTSPIGTVYRTGAPINELANLQRVAGGSALDVFRNTNRRTDGRCYCANFNFVAGARESHGTLYSGDAGSVTILY